MERRTASEKSLIVFHDKKIRRLWHDNEWLFLNKRRLHK